MNAPTKIATRTTLGEIASAALWLDEMRRRNLPPLNKTLLWAEWGFAKAQYDYFCDEATETALDDACRELGVDRDGEPLAGEAA